MKSWIILLLFVSNILLLKSYPVHADRSQKTRTLKGSKKKKSSKSSKKSKGIKLEKGDPNPIIDIGDDDDGDDDDGEDGDGHNEYTLVPIDCVVADGDTAYTYQRKTSSYLKQIDNIVNELIEEFSEFYESNIASMQTDDIIWDIQAGSRVDQLEGKEEVEGLWTSFAQREFAFHTLSNFEVDEVLDNKIQVKLRYHGVIMEGNNDNFEDIFGMVTVRYDDIVDGLIEHVHVRRFRTIDRGYGA